MMVIRSFCKSTRYFTLVQKNQVSQIFKSKNSFIKVLLPCIFVPDINQQTQIHTQAINKNLVFKSSETKVNDSKNPVVFLLSWMMSKEKHLEKYENVYLSQGFDVLMARLTPLQLMFPVNGSHIVAKQAANWLAERKDYTDITIHGFSVGGYLFGEFLNVINKNKQLYDNITNRVRGQVFDSIVAMHGIPTAFPRAVFNNPALVKLLEIYTKSHLALLKNTAVKHYENSYATFCDENFKVPSLFLMSKSDKLGYYGDMMKIVKDWQNRDMKVNYKCWENSPHCSHFLHHPKDYIDEISQLLETIGLLRNREKLPGVA